MKFAFATAILKIETLPMRRRFACVLPSRPFLRNISKTSASVSSGFRRDKLLKPRGRRFYCLRAFGNLMKHEARVFEITSSTKKISLNYHLNKFSQFNYYI